MKLKLIIESHFEPFLNEETNPRETESKKKWAVVNMVLSLKFNQLSCKYIKMLCQCYSFNFEHRIQCAPKTRKPYSCFVCICIVLVICSREIFSINRICVNVSSQHYRQQQKCDRIQSTYRN